MRFLSPLLILVLGGGIAACASEGPNLAAHTPHSLDTTEGAKSLEQVTREATEEQKDPAISPDGRFLAYEAVSPGQLPAVVVVEMSHPARPLFREARAAQPAWLADGSGLVFVSLEGSRQQVVRRAMDAPKVGALLVPVGDPEHDALWPALSPDGKTVASSRLLLNIFESRAPRDRFFDAALTVNTLNGYGVRSVLGSGIEPSFSPDGKRIAFVRKADGHGHVFVADLPPDDEGARAKRGVTQDLKATQLTDGPDEDAEPVWSPDGTRIAFCSTHSSADGVELAPSDANLSLGVRARADARGKRRANLFLIGTDGHGLVQITEGDGIACKPSWSKGGALYFHASEGTGFHIFRVQPKMAGTTLAVIDPPLPAQSTPEPKGRDSVEVQRARLAPKAACEDPIAGVWKAKAYTEKWGDWYEFTLNVRRDPADDTILRGEIHSHYWRGKTGEQAPPKCEFGLRENVVRMPAAGRVTEKGIVFGSSTYTVAKNVCGFEGTYAPDTFSGKIDPERLEFQSVDNDGDRAVNEPYVFRRVGCEKEAK